MQRDRVLIDEKFEVLQEIHPQQAIDLTVIELTDHAHLEVIDHDTVQGETIEPNDGRLDTAAGGIELRHLVRRPNPGTQH